MNKFIKTAVAAVFSALCVGGAAFALPKCNSDLQLQIGYRGQKTKFALEDERTDYEGRANAFSLSVANWNLFPITDMFSFGFMDTFGGWWGKCGDTDVKYPNGYSRTIDKDDAGSARGFDFSFGPAIGVRPTDILELRFAAAFAAGYAHAEAVDGIGDNNYCASVNAFSAGFALEAQVRFLPDKMFSPLVGFRYAFTVCKSCNMDDKYDDLANPGRYYAGGWETDDYKNNVFNVYVGAGWNF